MKKPFFLAGYADWLSWEPSVVKQYNHSIHRSIKITPFGASLKTIEKAVYSKLRDRRVRRKPDFKLGQLIHTAEIKRVFREGDSTNWSYILHTITEVNNDTIPNYKLNYKPETYNQNLILPTKISLDENIQIMKKLNLFQ